MNCPGSIKLSKGMVSEDSPYAIEGTRAHDVAEECLRQGAKACVVAQDEETAAAVQEYLDEIALVRASHEVIAEYVETMYEHPTIPGLGGTPDFVMLYHDNGKIVLHDFDYKHGVGVPVSAVENLQILTYFVILDENYPGMVDEFRGTIVQPRAAVGEKLQTWVCGPERVAEHAERIKAAMGQNHLAAGDWCRWCPALIICPEVQQHMHDMAMREFSELDTESLLHYESLIPAVKAFIEKIPAAILAKFKRGENVPGRKVIASYGHRRWKSVDRAVEVLEGMGLKPSDMYEQKMRTPPQVEKLLDKESRKSLEDLVIRPVVGHKVVAESAKGDPIDISNNDFDVIEEISSDES